MWPKYYILLSATLSGLHAKYYTWILYDSTLNTAVNETYCSSRYQEPGRLVLSPVHPEVSLSRAVFGPETRHGFRHWTFSREQSVCSSVRHLAAGVAVCVNGTPSTLRGFRRTHRRPELHQSLVKIGRSLGIHQGVG